MSVIFSLAVVLGLVAIGFVGAKVPFVFGVALPYVAFVVFLAGVIYRMVLWAKSPVPFHIPTTSGQQKSLPHIKHDRLDSPFTKTEVLGRMFLEVFFFRSLFRNTKTELPNAEKFTFGPTKWLWGAGMIFHYCFLIILVRHLRFFAEPVPFLINAAGELDAFFQIGLPILYLTDVGIMVGVTYLFLRRVVIPQIRYISQAADYFPLFLIAGIALTGIVMRYFLKVDVVGVKTLTMGLVSFSPAVPAGIGGIFYAHLLLVCALLIYFPFSKLMHAGGVFLSPTRNLANNSRAVRHVNPWNPKVKKHYYWEWEEEYKDKIEACGLEFDPEAKELVGEED
jgi:nitrate reductase gamma subunit